MTSTLLEPLNIHTISAARLLRNIDIALDGPQGPALTSPDSPTTVATPDDHFRIVRRVLTHALGQDISFSTRGVATADALQERKLSRLYQGAALRTLYAQVMGIPHAEVSMGSIQHFLARLAWLDESTVTTDTARSQLESYLYQNGPFWGPDSVPGRGDYAELGELLTAVPDDLREWMVQFKRGARLVPIAQWVALNSPRALYNGLAAHQDTLKDDGQRSPLARLCDALAGAMSGDESRDESLFSAIRRHLATPQAKASLMLCLQAIPHSDLADESVQVDESTYLSVPTGIEFFRKVVTCVVNPDDSPWLASILGWARKAPGMHALSLAIKLRFEHPLLAYEQAMALASLLLMPMVPSRVKLSETLPTAKALNTVAPRLDTWSTHLDPDYFFQQLGTALLCRADISATTLKWKAAPTWQALSYTAQFKNMFAPMLLSMGWYGGNPDELASPRITQALAGRAIIDYFLGPTAAFSRSLENDLGRDWVCAHSHVQLCGEVRALIQARNPGASPATVDMLHYLLLRETLPELLVEGVPDHLQYGRSLQSVALIHGVMLLEAMTPGLSLRTPYDELINVSAALADSKDASVQALWAQALITPALRYAAAHGAIERSGTDEVQHASAEQIRVALTYLKAQQDAHAQALNSLLSIKPPDRKHLAQQMLVKKEVDRRLWNDAIKVDHWPVLQQHGLTIASSYSVDRLLAVGRPQATVLELVMMGEAYVEGEATIPEAYAREFEVFRQALTHAQVGVIRRVLAEMQPDSLALLLGSTCELSRVRFGDQEGSQGLFIRCQQGQRLNDFHEHLGTESFFELIPAAGVIRRITQQFEYHVELDTGFSGNIVETALKQERNAERVALAATSPLQPLDSRAYVDGTVSRASTELHRAQAGILIPSDSLVDLPGASAPARLETLANAAATHLLARFMDMSNTEHLHETAWEDIWAKEREYADTAARLIIPFYGCIKDLAAGERSGGVIFGCVMDVAFALLPLGQFANSTARIILRAGEMSVLSVARLTGAAVSRLVVGLAEQSAVFMVRDLGRMGLKLTRFGWASVLKALPSLASSGLLVRAAQLDKGVYRIVDGLEHSALGTLAVVDGKSEALVRNLGTADTADFRLFDPESDRVFGKTLTVLSHSEPAELSVLSLTDSISPDHYPVLLPVRSIGEGFYEVRIAESCNVRAVQGDEGVFDVLVDTEIYHVDANDPDAVLRKLALEKLSRSTEQLGEIDNLCRVRRDLIAVPCVAGVKLATPPVEPVSAGSTSPKRTGKYPSHAMDAREFTLGKLFHPAEPGAEGIDVFIHEGKFCKWAEPAEAALPGKVVMPLSETELALFLLPDTPAYLTELNGVLVGDAGLGLPPNFTLDDARFIYENAPVIELGPIATGINDARALRGIRMDIEETDWIFVEADTGVFYKAPTPEAGSTGLKFNRVMNTDEINTFIRLSEKYRLIREGSTVLTDQQNIARLLFDLLDESERASWNVAWEQQLTTYDRYVEWCTANNKDNPLLGFATNILAGESMQAKFVELARSSIPDFMKITERSVPTRQKIVDTLNTLLPIQGATSRWETLSLENIVTSRITKNIMKQAKGANLSFARVSTESGEDVVYYALSGGQSAKDLKLQIDSVQSTERTIEGVVYRDARARMVGRAPDPGFTSLPVVRSADRVVVRAFERYLDSERLIATILKEDMGATRLSNIEVFTMMDTCRSCGGFVLPRLKLDFPDAVFSVTYIKDYKT